MPIRSKLAHRRTPRPSRPPSPLECLARELLRASVCSLALGSLTACGAAEGDSLSQRTSTTRQDLYVLTTAIWPSRSIRVCWETDGALTEKGWVQSAVAGTWQQFSGVEFVGWTSCDAAGANVRVRIADEAPNTVALGNQLDHVASGMVLDFTFAAWSPSCQATREFCVRAIAVHEFGHALGFAHEQNRADTPDTCAQVAQGLNGDTAIGDWDAMSVMNYCNPQWNNGGRISETDKFALQDYYGRPSYFVDVTGDGKADAIVAGGEDIYVSPSDGARSFGAREKWTDHGYAGSRGTYFADVTGHGRADAIAVDDRGIIVRRSTGSSFAADESWTDAPFYGSWGTFFADLTGDGRADAVAIDPDGITVRISNGSSFGPSQVWLAAGLPPVFDILFGDVTGDGRADLVLVTSSGVAVQASTGAAFEASTWFTTDAFYGARGTFLADVTGDGMADVIAVDDDRITVRRSTGAAFSEGEAWTGDACHGVHGTYFADVSGAGGARDAISVQDDGIYVRPSSGAAFDPHSQKWTQAPFDCDEPARRRAPPPIPAVQCVAGDRSPACVAAAKRSGA